MSKRGYVWVAVGLTFLLHTALMFRATRNSRLALRRFRKQNNRSSCCSTLSGRHPKGRKHEFQIKMHAASSAWWARIVYIRSQPESAPAIDPVTTFSAVLCQDELVVTTNKSR
jgi:hypothetical protein